ncbi:hypothetical protein O181_063910 [Austropuccinia psidii MF-1]|uniref:Uncharacterized protein n=1 Tax=Austropuccinia psidii MF-1 TaxID=1389203 RepID=A0A9Q3ES65_9BASI|nr:hypothetical protein [Austropuccinia psidii MF-1]
MTTSSHSLSILLTRPDVVNSVVDGEAIPESGETESLSDKYVAQWKDSPKKNWTDHQCTINSSLLWRMEHGITKGKQCDSSTNAIIEIPKLALPEETH